MQKPENLGLMGLHKLNPKTLMAKKKSPDSSMKIKSSMCSRSTSLIFTSQKDSCHVVFSRKQALPTYCVTPKKSWKCKTLLLKNSYKFSRCPSLQKVTIKEWQPCELHPPCPSNPKAETTRHPKSHFRSSGHLSENSRKPTPSNQTISDEARIS